MIRISREQTINIIRKNALNISCYVSRITDITYDRITKNLLVTLKIVFKVEKNIVFYALIAILHFI